MAIPSFKDWNANTTATTATPTSAEVIKPTPKKIKSFKEWNGGNPAPAPTPQPGPAPTGGGNVTLPQLPEFIQPVQKEDKTLINKVGGFLTKTFAPKVRTGVEIYNRLASGEKTESIEADLATTIAGGAAGQTLELIGSLMKMPYRRFAKRVEESKGFSDEQKKFDPNYITEIPEYATKLKDWGGVVSSKGKTSKQFFDNLSSLDQDKLSTQVVSTIGGVIPTVLLAYTTGGAGLATGIVGNSAVNAEQVYDENIKQGKTEEEATQKYQKSFNVNIILNSVFTSLGVTGKISGTSKSIFKNKGVEYTKDVLAEFIEENAEQINQNINTGKPWATNLKETSIVTLPVAALMGGLGNIGNSSNPEVQQIKEDIEKQLAIITTKVQNGEELTDQETVLYAVSNGKEKFVDQTTPQGIPVAPTIEEAIEVQGDNVVEEPVSEPLSLQEVTNDLADTGYTKADTTRIMADLYGQSPEGTFTRQQLEDIKGDYYPQIKNVTTITKDLQSAGYTEEQVSKIIADLYTSKPEGDFLNADINAETQKINGKDLYNIAEEQKAMQDKKDEKQRIKEEKQKAREEKMLERQKALDERQRAQEEKVIEKQKKLDQKVADAKVKIEEKNKKEQARLKEKQDKMNKSASDIKSKIKESNAKLDEIRAKRNTWVAKAEQLNSKILKSKTKVNTSIAKARLIEIRTKIKTIEAIIETRLKNVAELESRLKKFEQALTKGDIEIKKILDENTAEVKKVEDSVKPERLNLIEEIKRIKAEIKKQKDALLVEGADLEAIIEPEIVVTQATPTVEADTAVVPVEDAPKMKTTKTAERLAEKLIEDGVPVDFKNRAQYQTKNIEEEFKRVTEFINSDFEKAVAVIDGTENLPNGIQGELLLEKMREYVSKNRNPDLEYKLLNSPLLTRISESAQSLRLAQEINTDSAISKAEAIKKERKNRTGEKTIQDLERDLAVIIKASEEMNLSEDDLDIKKFLDENKC